MQSSVGDGAAANANNAVAQHPQENQTNEITKPKGKAGRPKVVIDWELVGSYLEAGAKTVDIAAAIGCDEDTLYKRCRKDNKIDFSAFSQARKAKGEMLLRVEQHNLAIAGNERMLMFLGKVRLGQREQAQPLDINVTQTVRVIEPYVDALADAEPQAIDADVQILLPAAGDAEDYAA